MGIQLTKARTLFGAEQERVVRLAALVHLELELGMGGGDLGEQPVERRAAARR